MAVNRKPKLHTVTALVLAVLIYLLSAWTQVAMADPFDSDLTRTIDSSKPIVVSMGDSYSAGQGAPPYYGQGSKKKDSEYHDYVAHRSQNAWSGKLSVGSGKDRITLSEYHDSNWLFVACTGAVSSNITGKDVHEATGEHKDNGQQDPQENNTWLQRQSDILDKLYSSGMTPDYVTLTIGGNDIGFADIAKKNLIAAASDAYKYHTQIVEGMGIEIVSPSYIYDALRSMWDEYYTYAQYNIMKAYSTILEKTKGSDATLLVAGYPLLFAPTDESNMVINANTVIFNRHLEILTKRIGKKKGRRVEFIYVFDAFGDEGIIDSSGKVNATITDKYGWHGAGSGKKNEWINGYLSSLSTQEWIHPSWCGKDDCGENGPDCGVSAYAAAVQARIDQIEQQQEETSLAGSHLTTSTNRAIAMVLDVSGSMAGEPLDATKSAARKFVSVALENGAQTALISYDDDAEVLSDFSANEVYLKTVINRLSDRGGTNMESGLAAARSLLFKEDSDDQYIVLMSDGQPNAGKTGSELISYAESIRDPNHDGKDDVIIYALGFNEDASGQELLKAIASDGCYISVHSAGDLEDFFTDVVDSINGVKFMYARIACPVDVSVTFEGETLDSAGEDPLTRTSFGSLTFEEGENGSGEDSVKVLRLREGQSYDIVIEGTGFGAMDYSIGFIDDEGIYSDFRTFSGVDITDQTVITTTAEVSETTMLAVDENGDGTADKTYRAGANQEGELIDNSWVAWAVVAGFAFVPIAFVGMLMWRAMKRHLT